jgi:hypothetical protein
LSGDADGPERIDQVLRIEPSSRDVFFTRDLLPGG